MPEKKKRQKQVFLLTKLQSSTLAQLLLTEMRTVNTVCVCVHTAGTKLSLDRLQEVTQLWHADVTGWVRGRKIIEKKIFIYHQYPLDWPHVQLASQQCECGFAAHLKCWRVREEWSGPTRSLDAYPGCMHTILNYPIIQNNGTTAK